MNVYVESNVVLELALLQEQSDSCERILGLVETDGVHLVISAYCPAEPYEVLTRRRKRRTKMKRELDAEFGQIARTEIQADRLRDFHDQYVIDELAGYGCELLRDFGAGYGFIVGSED